MGESLTAKAGRLLRRSRASVQRLERLFGILSGPGGSRRFVAADVETMPPVKALSAASAVSVPAAWSAAGSRPRGVASRSRRRRRVRRGRFRRRRGLR